MMNSPAQQILSLIDLTSLNDNDSQDNIIQLCDNSVTKFGNVAAICIYSHFIPVARELYAKRNLSMKIATVVNFPHGSLDLERALFETKLALERGADEVDIVFPYHALIGGNQDIGAQMIAKAKQLCSDKVLKVIIESGELNSAELIKTASEIAIENGADFIKTSTGKVKINATLAASEIMLNAIKTSGAKCGFKAAGGIRNINEAVQYLELAETIMGEKWVSSTTFRFGASALLQDVLAKLNGKYSDQKANAADLAKY